jgi:hypothetical protein
MVPYVHLATFRDGMLARVEGYPTWADAVAAAEASTE